MVKEDNFYFVYHMHNGLVFPQTWRGEVTVGGVVMETLAKIRITEEEFNKLSITELSAKYPYSG